MFTSGAVINEHVDTIVPAMSGFGEMKGVYFNTFKKYTYH